MSFFIWRLRRVHFVLYCQQKFDLSSSIIYRHTKLIYDVIIRWMRRGLFALQTSLNTVDFDRKSLEIYYFLIHKIIPASFPNNTLFQNWLQILFFYFLHFISHHLSKRNILSKTPKFVRLNKKVSPSIYGIDKANIRLMQNKFLSCSTNA